MMSLPSRGLVELTFSEKKNEDNKNTEIGIEMDFDTKD